MSIHAKDQDQIERLHGMAVAEIHERLITLQDASYELGYARGLEQGKAQRHALIEALRHIEGVAMADEPRDLPGIAQTARAAIAKAGGAV